MKRRFDPSTIESCSEIPAFRGPEELSLLNEVDPISGKESVQHPDAYPKEYWKRVENLSRNYICRKITGDITIEFLEAAVERMFTADEVSTVVEPAKLKELKHRDRPSLSLRKLPVKKVLIAPLRVIASET